MNAVLKAHLAILTATLIYAGNYTIAKEVMPEYILPFGFILMRVTTGAVVFFFLHYFTSREKINPKDLKLLAICGIFGIMLNQLMFFKGLNWTTPIHASLIMTTTPILVLIVSSLLIGEVITKRKIGGIALGALGAIGLITYGKNIGSGENGWIGDILIFINATSFGIYLVLVKSLMVKYRPITVMKWIFLFGWFFVFPFGIGEFLQIDWQTFSPGIWIAVAYVLLLVTVGAYFCNALALESLNPSTVSAYIYLQPLLASLISIMAGKDQISAITIFAAMLIFTGVYLVGSKQEKWTMGKGKLKINHVEDQSGLE